MFWELKYAQIQLIKTIQYAFEYAKNAPTTMHIWTWHKKFQVEACQYKVTRSGWQPVSKEMVEGNLSNRLRNSHNFEFFVQILMNKSYFTQH